MDKEKNDVEFINFLSSVCCMERRQTNAMVTLSWFVHFCVPPCWLDDIWHRFHVLDRSLFDACTNTGAETTVSKCFDAISQQSVKLKNFVAFFMRRTKTFSTQKDAEFSRQEPSLFY